eukprot:scaffold5783_cov57-Phaeocystis_antarctica.AAC.3
MVRVRGERQDNGRRWWRLARAPEAVDGRPVARLLPGEHRTSQGHQACREGAAHTPCWGTAQAAL